MKRLNYQNFGYKIISMAFGLFLFVSAIQVNCIEGLSALLDIAVESENNGMESPEEDADTMSVLADKILEELPEKNALIRLSGSMMKKAGVRSYYNSEYGINVTDSGYIVGRYEQTSADYEIEQMISLQEYLNNKGIKLLYVSEPAKYIDDNFYWNQFGGESYLNRNTEVLLNALDEAGIEYIDLRDNITAQGRDPLSLFYRTDHHWTVPASKWAARIIADRLNNDFGYQIDLTCLNDERFEAVLYQEAWVGEAGKKIGESYVGRDDYTMLEPLYNTSYTVISGDEVRQDDFAGTFIDKTYYEQCQTVDEQSSWHYSYRGMKNKEIYNDNVESGSILLLGDSYENSMLPFLSLCVHHIYHVQPRDAYQSVRQYIEEHDFDTVIIAYPQFMIGAHDDENNGNYNQFNFE